MQIYGPRDGFYTDEKPARIGCLDDASGCKCREVRSRRATGFWIGVGLVYVGVFGFCILIPLMKKQFQPSVLPEKPLLIWHFYPLLHRSSLQLQFHSTQIPL